MLGLMSVGRRAFLSVAAAGAGFYGLRRFLKRPEAGVSARYGRLKADPLGFLRLPEGFRCAPLSATGDAMNDGLRVPGGHDGMAAFAGPGGRTILVRNHELDGRQAKLGPFGPKNEKIGLIPKERFYDFGSGRVPGQGGTTTLVLDPSGTRVERQFLSLAGTWRNCAGGPTPWGSWLTCEEEVRVAGGGLERDHGYVFEVPASDAIGLADPEPLRAMGRFNHEAAAVDPKSGDILLTEDRLDGLLYRFTPRSPGELRKGGRLRALAVRGRPSLYTANRGRRKVKIGEPMEVEWIDLDDVDAPKDDLRVRGFKAGAAAFARGEGIWATSDGIYFCATTGGDALKGQVWRWRPGPPETLELFCEPDDAELLENCDNLCAAPWGDLFMCEDGPGGQRVVAVTPNGELYVVLENILNAYELCGGCFSPDGSTFYVNLQRPGVTLAVQGPWKKV
jgi:secreted PhoX family phosphatase